MRHSVVYSILVAILLVMAGCSVSHVRTAEDLPARVHQLRNFLVLTPELEVQMKYISTDCYFTDIGKIQLCQRQMVTGYREKLQQLGYEVATEPEIQTPPYTEAVARIRKELRALGEEIIVTDIEYAADVMFPQLLKHLKSDIPPEWQQYDAVIFGYGDARLETDAEFTSRWLKNISYNLALLPLSFTSMIFPIVLPITLSTSSFTFKKSPDKSFLNIVVLDLHDKSIIYQYDYSSADIGLSSDHFYGLAGDTLDKMPEKPHKPKTGPPALPTTTTVTDQASLESQP